MTDLVALQAPNEMPHRLDITERFCLADEFLGVVLPTPVGTRSDRSTDLIGPEALGDRKDRNVTACCTRLNASASLRQRVGNLFVQRTLVVCARCRCQGGRLLQKRRDVEVVVTLVGTFVATGEHVSHGFGVTASGGPRPR